MHNRFEKILHFSYFINRMIPLAEIKKVAKRIGTTINAKSIILFGSYARGVANENSDVDLMVIADSNLPRFKRSRKIYKVLNPYPFAMDLLVYTPFEIEKGKKSPISFVSRVLREGKKIYVGRD